MQLIIFAVLIVCILNEIHVIVGNPTEPDYYRYLQQFGYTPKVEGRRLFTVIGKSTYSEGIRKFQRLYKLPETGELDERTRSLMQRARCGNPDLGTVTSVKQPLNVDITEPPRLAQGRAAAVKAPQGYVTHTVVWPKKHLKWFIEQYPKYQSVFKSEDRVRHIVKQAFDDWEKNSGLSFEMATNVKDADLKIKFNAKDHGDGYPFDGPGATLAHAFYPTSGDIHFDDDEQFIEEYIDINDKYNLRLVAAHEIGHALGLSHSFEEESLMFPVYQLFPKNFTLSFDDLQGIQTLYGKPDEKPTTRITKAPTVTRNPQPSSNPLPKDHWCSGDFQTGCEGPDGSLYLFNDDQVWRYNPRSQRSWDSKPTTINKRFQTFTDTRITACVRASSGYVYLFRNYRMWKLRTHWSGEGPHMLNGKNYPQNPHAALLHQNHIYLIRNRLIYRLNEYDIDQELEIGTIDSILNPPPNEFIIAGFTYKKKHYIFTNDDVYVYDATNGYLLPGYPRLKVNGWFACEGASELNQKPSKRPNHNRNDHSNHRHRHEQNLERKPHHWRNRHT